MFDIVTSRDYLAKLEADFADFMKEPGSEQRAVNCAITAFHLHEWVWTDWLKADSARRQFFGAATKGDFVAAIVRACPWFLVMQEIANAAKHTREPSFKTIRVSLLPEARNLPNAGAEDSHWDGPMPFLTGDTEVLLIDNGPESEVHRWMLMGQLLYVVLQFWRQFFESYAPRPAEVSRSASSNIARTLTPAKRYLNCVSSNWRGAASAPA
jgi:hypothetical protein